MSNSHSSTLTGWREWVRVQQAGLPWVKAKIDTGAQTSAVHAFDVEEFERDGESWVKFGVNPWQANDSDASTVERPIHDRRSVKSSNGQSEERIVVLLELELVGRKIEAEVTLTNRDEMGFRMLIGREVLQQGFLVDSSASFLGDKPKSTIRERNRRNSLTS
ncbi:MAG: ATP-dependent zinc protease family protein [Canibacter sp.]